MAVGVSILCINTIVKADTHPSKVLGYISGEHLRCYDPERNMVFSHQPYSMTSCGGDSYRISEKDYQRLIPEHNVYENDKVICYNATDGWSGKWSLANLKYVKKALQLGLRCGIKVNKPSISSALSSDTLIVDALSVLKLRGSVTLPPVFVIVVMPLVFVERAIPVPALSI